MQDSISLMDQIVKDCSTWGKFRQVHGFPFVYLFWEEGATEMTLITELAKIKQKLTDSQPWWGLKCSSYL